MIQMDGMVGFMQINLLGIMMLLLILFFLVIVQRDTAQKSARFFVGLTSCNLGILALSCVMGLLYQSQHPITAYFFHGVLIGYFILQALFGYLMFCYTIHVLYPDLRIGRRLHLLLQTPLLFNVVMTASSPFTGWMYMLTEDNRYYHGTYMLSVSIGTFALYWLISAMAVLYEKIHPTKNRPDSVYPFLLLLPFPTLVGNLLNFFFSQLTTAWIFSAFYLLLLFVNQQNHQLSRDSLTGLYSRSQTNKRIRWEIRHMDEGSHLLFVMMVDVDHFKNINDSFGHLTGDEALVKVAEILKAGCRRRDFIGRFGGDEFIVIGHVQDLREVNAVANNITQLAEQYNRTARTYRLSLSIGTQLYSREDVLSMDSIIAQADEEMYRMKQRRPVLGVKLRGEEG